MTQNSMTQNSMTQNSMTQNSMTQNSMTQNALTQSSLTQNSLVMADLTNDPLSIEFMKYVVGCALPASTSITLNISGTDYTWDGQLGIAPGWGDANGSCDGDCQKAVSACVISRVNYLGQTVDISVRGASSALATTSQERSDYPNREGAYFGNVFVSPQQLYACTSPSSTLISRVCGSDYATEGCGAITIVGDCDQACDTVDATAGYYGACHNATRTAPSTYPSGTLSFSTPVTVYRQ